MDKNREILDMLMGRDRNKTKDQVTTKDHYSNKDVCKSFLICFCFNTLFPNTVYDQGPCEKRHDPYLKTMFDSDTLRSDYERTYLNECINWIEKRLAQVQNRIKKNQALIENKSNYPTERPKEIVDRLISIDKQIEETMNQVEIFGQNGQILDSERCMIEVQRLRQKRKQIELMGDNMVNAQKQQKICEICGAIQTINDTEKRIQTHLEGKIHQGFLRLRHEIQTLKIRLDILTNLERGKDEKQKPEKQIKKSRSRSHRKKSKERVKEEPDRYRQRQKEHKQDKQRDRAKEKDGSKGREKEKRDKSKDRKEHKKKHKKDHSRD